MRTITKIVKCPGSRKYQVYEEKSVLFSLYASELSLYQLTEGEDLDDARYERICTEVLIPRARKRVLNLLLSKDYSQHELEEKLNRDGYPEKIAENAISYAKDYHYVDDLRLAVTYLRARQEQKSSLYLRQKLMEKGVSNEVIEEAFTQVREERMVLLGDEFEEAEQVALARELQKKIPMDGILSEKERQKLFSSLCAKGFRAADIAKQLRLDYME